MRFAVRLVAFSLAAVALAFGAATFTSRERLDERRDAVEFAWARVVDDLAVRYDALATANDAVRANGGSARSVVGEIDGAIADWNEALDRNDLAAGLRSATRLEGLARRLEANIGGSPRLGSNESTLALAAFSERAVDVDVLNDAITEYAEAQAGAVRSVVAATLGHDPLVVLAA